MENMMMLHQEKKCKGKHSGNFSGLKSETIYKIRIMSEIGIQKYKHIFYNSNLIWRTVSGLVDEVLQIK